jgi:PAS domain S-box-containing protein
MASPPDELPYVGQWLDHTEDAIVVCGADWRVTVWNEGARRMFGWTAEEVIGQPATVLGLAEHDGERLDRRRHLAEDGHWRGELAVERKDGTAIPVDGDVVAIRGADAEISGYLGILRDITERRTAEEALEAATRRTDEILEQMCETFLAIDDQWRYTYVNDQAVARAGKAWGREASVGDFLGKNCWDVFPETVGTAIDRELHRAVREQRMVQFETYSVVGACLPVRGWVVGLFTRCDRPQAGTERAQLSREHAGQPRGWSHRDKRR